MNATHTIISEQVAAVPSMVGLVTIGQKLGQVWENGRPRMALTRYGMALPPDRPMSDMPAYVNDAGPETPAKNPVDYWAEKNAALIRAQVRALGWAAVDLSGHCFAREIAASAVLSPAGDAAGWPFTVEAIRRTLAQVGSEPNDRWVFWANPEPAGGTDPRITLAFFRKLWSSGITRDAAVIATNMVGGYTPKRQFLHNPRAIDGRHSEIPCWLDWAPTPVDSIRQSVSWLADAQNAGLTPWAHLCAVGYDGKGQRTPDLVPYQLDLIETLKRAGFKHWLVNNYAGRVPGAEDFLVQQEADAATVEAICGEGT